jgi:hypothetical protein
VGLSAKAMPAPARPFCFAGGPGLNTVRSIERYTDEQSKGRMRKTLLASAVLIALCILFSCSNISLRRSSDSIQSELMKETPIGTAYGDVLPWLKKKKLQWLWIDGQQIHNVDSAKWNGSRINISLGEYHTFLLATSVVVDYQFDSTYHLESLKVSKATDGP